MIPTLRPLALLSRFVILCACNAQYGSCQYVHLKCNYVIIYEIDPVYVF